MIQPPPQFAATPESIVADAQRLVQHSRQSRDELVRNITPSEATFANFLLPIAHIENEYNLHVEILLFYGTISEDKQVREASQKAQVLFADFRIETLMREDHFTRILAVRERAEDLDQESAWFLKRLYDSYIRSGIGISDATQRQRFKEIRARESVLKAEFMENYANDKTSISFQATDLDGVPAEILSQLEKTDVEEEYKVVFADSPWLDILKYATKAETRKRLFIDSQNRWRENRPILKEAVILRREASHLLGFPNHAALQIHYKMPKDAEVINTFLADLRSRLTPGALEAVQQLKDLKKADLESRGEVDEHDGRFFIWDKDFYHNLLLQQDSPFDRETIKEYFPVQTPIQSMIEVFSHLFGLEFTELTGSDKPDEIVWHNDVQAFSVHDIPGRGGGFLGYLYLDLYHRSGKNPQPSCYNLQPGFTKKDGSRHHPATAVLCDFTKPTPHKPSLLTHWEVVLLFHELGHGIHDVVSKTRFSRFHGPPGVTPDFGELPSQLLEQWCWEASPLKTFSCHYSYLNADMHKAWEKANPATPQPERHIPDAVIQHLLQTRHRSFGPLFLLAQIRLATFDMAIHQVFTQEEAEALDLAVAWNKLRREIDLLEGPEAVLQGDYTWGHGYGFFSATMSSDYDAGYYAYLYSQVFAADLFYSTFKHDLLNSQRGQEYRQCILEKGGSRDEMQMIVDFR